MASATDAPVGQACEELYVSPTCFVQTAESRVSTVDLEGETSCGPWPSGRPDSG